MEEINRILDSRRKISKETSEVLLFFEKLVAKNKKKKEMNNEAFIVDNQKNK